MQRFGPINGVAGKRRLNVLFTRAKEQIVTFSSMTAGDILANENGNPGVFMLKSWLEYSKTGFLEIGTVTNREPDSDFEIFVAQQISSMGCTPVHQVGVAGFFIDIGVKHPDWPHGYILGIECDGASYHSSRSARDRDRLRQDVLENLGWTIHRIWSTDWFNNPQAQGERLREVIKRRIMALKEEEAIGGSSDANDGEVPEGAITDLSSSWTLESNLVESGVENEVQNFGNFASSETAVEVGDRVRIRFLTGDKKTLEITFTDGENDPENGNININEPLGRAVIGAEEGDEVDVLVGSFIRNTLIESITKGTAEVAGSKQKDDTEKPLEEFSQNYLRASNFTPESLTSDGGDVGESSVLPASSVHQPSTSQAPKNFTDPDLFYSPEYRDRLRELSIELIDELGPITFPHLSEKLARMHGFKRTDRLIKKSVWAAVGNLRKTSKDPRGQNIFWPHDQTPSLIVPFRGMAIGNVRRDWQEVPHPELMGLAKDILVKWSDNQVRVEPVSAMSKALGLRRLRQKTRLDLEELLNLALDIMGT
jgi:hypothetical protein